MTNGRTDRDAVWGLSHVVHVSDGINPFEAARGEKTTVTYDNAVSVTENHLRFVTGRHTACKRLVNVFRVIN